MVKRFLLSFYFTVITPIVKHCKNNFRSEWGFFFTVGENCIGIKGIGQIFLKSTRENKDSFKLHFVHFLECEEI